MAEEQSAQERSEEPTAKRLDESRKKGQVARSRELNTFFVVVGGLTFILLLGGELANSTANLMTKLLSPTGELIVNPQLLLPYLGSTIQQGIGIVAPILLATVILALLGPTVMGGFSFSLESLAFKLEKLDPIKGVTRIFSVNGLVELAKGLLKFFLIAAIAIFLFFQLQQEIMVLARLNIVEGIVRSGEIILWASVLAALSLIFIAAVDIPFQLWSHNKKLRMTKQEVKDESKETDGRPEVKAKIRQLQMQAAQRRMLEDVPKADVVITNPTHFSVALKYDTSRSSAPVVVAKGYDLIALKIRSIAADNGVPIYEEPPLARALYASTELGEEIPAPLFLAVARVLAYVFQLTRSAPTDYVPRPKATPLPEDFSKYNEEAL